MLDQVITAPPSDGQDAVVRHQTGDAEYYGITVRRKTMADLFVTARVPNKTTHFDVPAGQSVQINHNNDVYTVANEVLETSTSVKAPAFRAPHASIVGRRDGWWVTFTPDQKCCVLTLAIPPMKNEAIPSFPFPESNGYSSASWLLPLNQFGATVNGPVRLGVRGAGLSFKGELPAVGETLLVTPDMFILDGPPNRDLLKPAYVEGKYAEKAGLLSWA